MRAGQKSKTREAVHDPGNSDAVTSVIRFMSGSRVPQSGIYEVIHHGEHRQAYEAVLVSGNLFPRCEGCDGILRFRLLRAVPYIFHDHDFATESRVANPSSLDVHSFSQ